MTDKKKEVGIWLYDGLDLWNSVEETDVDYTKGFDKGSFKGTAVDAVMNIKRITEKLGPVGRNWGWRITGERYDTFGVGEDAQTVHSLTIRVWFRQEDGSMTEVDSVGTTKLAYWTRSRRPGDKPRYLVDDEAQKKSITDAISRVMMWLGASADIWLGRFDGNKYVAPKHEENGHQPPPPPDDKLLDHARDILAKIKTAHASDEVVEQGRRVRGTFGEQPFWPQIVSADRDLAAEIQQLMRGKAKAHGIDLSKV